MISPPHPAITPPPLAPAPTTFILAQPTWQQEFARLQVANVELSKKLADAEDLIQVQATIISALESSLKLTEQNLALARTNSEALRQASKKPRI